LFSSTTLAEDVTVDEAVFLRRTSVAVTVMRSHRSGKAEERLIHLLQYAVVYLT
jgi:hypothetical protein